MPANNGTGMVDAALGRAEQMARSLRQSGTIAQSVEDAAQRLAAGGNEQAAAAEQMRSAVESVATGVEQTAQVVQSMTRSQAQVAELTRDVSRGFESTNAALQELSASVGAVRK